ncbi:MAG: YchJ family protein [Gammaproteobacteria bacterium]|nr:YchJ family protein [Gammaproteobacteria bacterium]
MSKCPCGSGLGYDKCCEVFIAGKKNPETPEQLMRSRYSAFVKKDLSYIKKTLTGPAAKEFAADDNNDWINQITWDNLQILNTKFSNENPNVGYVEFLISFTLSNGRKKVMHEISEFRKKDGHWLYFDGVYPKTGRNDPCPCGSNKKHKKCCGK